MSKENLVMDRDQAVKSVLPFIRSYARKWAKTPEMLDDMIQEGALGAVLAYDNFDSSKNVKFFTYSSYYIMARIRDYHLKDSPVKISTKKAKDEIKKAKQKKEYVRKQYTAQEFNEEYIGCITTKNTEDTIFAHSLICWAKRFLTEIEFNIITLRLQGYTHAEILNKVDNAAFKSRQRVQQIEEIALNKLRKHINSKPN